MQNKRRKAMKRRGGKSYLYLGLSTLCHSHSTISSHAFATISTTTKMLTCRNTATFLTCNNGFLGTETRRRRPYSSSSNKIAFAMAKDAGDDIDDNNNNNNLAISMDEQVVVTDDEIKLESLRNMLKTRLWARIPSLEEAKDIMKDFLRNAASLSLLDYQWRSSLFKSTEAERQVEQSLARMMGEDPAYVRPMDATDDKIGPLGRAEKELVQWLSSVIEEEGKRARLIADSDGNLVRPMDLSTSGDAGPLSNLERSVVEFINSIVISENERVKSGGSLRRPKDLDESKRGPLGEAEARAVKAFQEMTESEKIRFEQSFLRGEQVRPLDIPGPLGEFERSFLEIVDAERSRAKEGESNNDGKVVRPMNAAFVGPLGQAERQAIEELDRIKEEETERLRSIQRVLVENRPMVKAEGGIVGGGGGGEGFVSLLGFTEAVVVGLFRAPRLLGRVIDRVTELMNSSVLEFEEEEEEEKEQDVKPLAPAGSDVNDDDDDKKATNIEKV